jgi:poly(3-hydroxybutyrate) depolymerase
MRFLGVIGPPVHLMAICQPCVAALAATALMAEDDHPATPASLTLMAGPIDCRVSPTEVNKLATDKPIGWFEQHLISTVPLRYPGALRKVYPGFLQLMAFMSMNLDRHLDSFRNLFHDLVNGETDKANATKTFYREYFAVCDLPAEFYLETVRLVFQEYALPQGKLTWRGRRVDPAAIRRTALLTVEGERDDICSLGQTLAAHDLCAGLRGYLKTHYVQAGAAITACSAASAGAGASTPSCGNDPDDGLTPSGRSWGSSCLPPGRPKGSLLPLWGSERRERGGCHPSRANLCALRRKRSGTSMPA